MCLAYQSGSKTNKLFKNQSLLDEHYGKHGQEIADVLGDSNYSIDKYLDDANYVATLHHSQQRSVGPLFEASTRYHNISNAKKGPLHPYKGQLNPFNPMDSNTRGLFQKVDSIEYWKARGRDAMKGVQ